MELLTTKPNDKIGDRLCAELREAKNVCIASAYFLPDQKVLDLLSKVPDLKIVISEEFNINNPDKLKPLASGGRVRCVPTSGPCNRGRLHAKVLWGARSDSSEFAIVGSANLTTEGLFSNQEACIFFDSRSKGDAQIIATVSAWLNDVWTNAVGFHYEKAKAVFDSTCRHWKRKTRIYAQDSAIPNYWVVKTKEGYGGENYWDQFRQEGVIAIGWKELPISPAEVSTQGLISALKSVYGYTTLAAGIAANTIRRFTDEVKPSDMVIISDGYNKWTKEVYLYGIARVVGEFEEETGLGWRFTHHADIQLIERYFPRALFVDSLGKKSQMKTLHDTKQANFEKLCNTLRSEYGIMITV